MRHHYHLCLDLRGALMNWSDRELANAITHDNGKKMTAREAKNALMDEIAKGREVIPCAPCDNFDYQTGCQGHIDLETPETASTGDVASAGKKEGTA